MRNLNDLLAVQKSAMAAETQRRFIFLFDGSDSAAEMLIVSVEEDPGHVKYKSALVRMGVDCKGELG